MYIVLILLKHCYMDDVKCVFLKKIGKHKHIQNYQNKLVRLINKLFWEILNNHIYFFQGFLVFMTYIYYDIH